MSKNFWGPQKKFFLVSKKKVSKFSKISKFHWNFPLTFSWKNHQNFEIFENFEKKNFETKKKFFVDLKKFFDIPYRSEILSTFDCWHFQSDPSTLRGARGPAPFIFPYVNTEGSHLVTSPEVPNAVYNICIEIGFWTK